MTTTDTTTYDKAAHHPIGHGYSNAAGASPFTSTPAPRYIASIMIHTTNDPADASFEHAAEALLHHPVTSAHFLVGAGRIIQFLDPSYVAWHAPSTYDRRFANERSIGITLDWSHAKGPMPASIKDSAYSLVESLLALYPSIRLIDTYRSQVKPRGSAIDPCGWGDADFYAWADQLLRSRAATAKRSPVFQLT